ncbi:MAG: nitroreductase family protein [Promethearchaeota archaeon]|jgi:nitroreductase/NAD-dependent dihydropyrimidine dehydrogenase PreA subunit
MPITGIDYERCNGCKMCAIDCTRDLFLIDASKKVNFEDSENSCNLCGHCVAVCPENAIQYDAIGDDLLIFDGIEKLDTIIPFENMNKFLRGHRSVRHYKSKEVPKHILQKVVTLMQYAPTASNMRSEKYTVISDREKLKSISDAVVETLITHPGMKSRYKERFKFLGKKFDIPIFFDAPHVIFVSSAFDTRMADQNIGIIITYGRLVAESLGLGTCWNGWTQIAVEIHKKILKLIGTRGSRIGAFTIGYPNITFRRCPPRPRKPIKGL